MVLKLGYTVGTPGKVFSILGAQPASQTNYIRASDGSN